ncbi:MAG TPA: mobilization protein [Paludibacter sp.]
MKNNRLEYIILYVLVASAALIIATLARISAFSLGVDNFTAFIVFIVVFGIEVALYLSIHVVLQGLMLPWIARQLLKVPYFKNKTKSTPPIDKIANQITQPPSLEDIRNEQLQNKAKEQEEKLNIALRYTRKTFAPYVSDGQIEVLCGNLQLYADKLNLEKLRSIKTCKDLSSVDISHFGWNIWNHFNVGKRIEIAHFLKRVFPDILKDVEFESIKSHLKDDELKGIIKIRKSLTEQ